MDRATLGELGFSSRAEALGFLKRLWRSEDTPCPLCGNTLVTLHSGAKKSDCDWQCRPCGKVFRTMHLLDEINSRFPD